jgi:hypothetical protein
MTVTDRKIKSETEDQAYSIDLNVWNEVFLRTVNDVRML